MTAGKPPKALLIGHFSTFGDLEVLEVVKSWLRLEGLPFDVAPYAKKVRAGDSGFVDPRVLDGQLYSHLIVVCGPFRSELLSKLHDVFEKFSHCVWIGVNLTMIEPLDSFNPFDVLIDRDSDKTSRPDLAISRSFEQLPVVGLCLATKQSEYGDRRRHKEANDIIRRVIRDRGFACVELDTRWPPSTNSTAIETGEQFVAVASKLDLVLTTRLHGLVLSLKAGTPVVAVDAISGGDKVSKQPGAIGWNEIVSIDNLTMQKLSDSIDRCLEPTMRKIAVETAQRGSKIEPVLRQLFVQGLSIAPKVKNLYISHSKTRKF